MTERAGAVVQAHADKVVQAHADKVVPAHADKVVPAHADKVVPAHADKVVQAHADKVVQAHAGHITLPQAQKRELEQAIRLLESQNFAVRIAEYAGRPLAHALGLVPGANATLRRIVHSAIMRSLEMAVDSLEEEAHPPSSWLPKVMTGLSGGIGGLFGLAALPFELPLTTTLMLRSIADIARHHGEDLSKVEARLACLEVFALGGRKADAKNEIGYYAARAAFAKLSGDLVAYLMERSVLEVSAPVVTRIVSTVVSSFGMVVSERAAASAVPVLGAVGGATLNMIFMDHFEHVARGHFALRRLERMHGRAEIGRLYAELKASASGHSVRE